MFNLEIKTLIVGPLLTNCYIIADKKTKQAFILDPGAAPEKILSTLSPEKGRGPPKRGAAPSGLCALGALRPMTYDPTALLVTHCHFDHIGAVAQLKKKLNVPFLIPKGEEPVLALAKATAKIWTGQEVEISPKPDGFLKEGDEIRIGKIKLKVISTPGHSPDGVSLYCQQEKILFSGDTLFAGSIGRTDLPGGSDEKMGQSLKKLLKLPDETLVFPGHGEKTTIGEEKKGNPFLRNLKV